MNVAIVEDDMIIQMFLEEIIEKLGFCVSVFNCPQEFIDYDYTKFKIVISDIGFNHSEIDGVEMIKKIQHKFDGKVIFVSGNNDNETISRIENLSGEIEFVKKPIDENKLRSILSLDVF